MSNKLVVGLGFGDEGKGMFVDYLCSTSPDDSAVVRFSGGHQVSHTVVNDKTRHVFSNFGSGTLRGCPTYWSKFCTLDPVGLMYELDVLQQKRIFPVLYIDGNVMITTPLDIESNQKDNKNIIHGSCGVGFGKTIERNEKGIKLTYQDLFYDDILQEKLRLIYKYYGIDYISYKTDYYEYFVECCVKLRDRFTKVYSIPNHKLNYIFEGSQGLLLDQNFGFYPNVTRSNTGSKNALELCESFDSVYLITRAYQTRHGNGFMTNENIAHNIADDLQETNVINKYQGNFRKSLLDLSLIKYAIEIDDYIRESTNKNLVITCLDHIVDEYRFTWGCEIIYCSSEKEFVYEIGKRLGITKVYLSYSSDAKVVVDV